MPDPLVYCNRGHGINISSTKLTHEVIQNCHKNGKLVGVWINREVFDENDNFYQDLIDMGVDFLCTDFPQKADSVRKSANLRLNEV